MAAIKWFLSFLKKYRLRLAVAFFFVTLNDLFMIVTPKITKHIVDDVIYGGMYEILPKLLIIWVCATLLRSGFRYFYLYLFESTSQGMLYTMRDFVYRKIMAEDFSFYNRTRTGDLMSRQTGDMDALRHFTAYVMYSVYENILLFLIAIVMIFTIDWKVGLCILAIIPFTALTATKQMKAIKPGFRKIREQFSSLNSFVQENVSGYRVVRAFAKEDYEKEKFKKENDAYRDAQLTATATWRKYVPIFEFMASVMTVLLYFVGGMRVINGSITLGDMIQISGFFWMINQPLRMSGWLANDVQNFVTSCEKIYSTVIDEPSITDPNNALATNRLRGEVEFDHVSYSVDGAEILHDISFHISPGQTVGIIGATGSGKTTLMNLMCRFYDVDSGEVKIDGTNVKAFDLKSLRNGIGMAMQDVFLFSDTIEGNIAYSNPDCSFEDVKRAAELADADSFIMEMPDKYDTIVGERGMGLSGGQKQRISLARALLKDPAILILDDTTSAVDTETEMHIQEALSGCFKQWADNRQKDRHTVFLIAHRISSIKDADVILVVNDGRIIEQGHHEELLAKDGYYATICHHQYGDDDLTGKEDK